MSKKEWFGPRGTDIAMVYQDALSSLNPLHAHFRPDEAAHQAWRHP